MFINPKCISPCVVLYSVLLEDKKKFKHGGVISVAFASNN